MISNRLKTIASFLKDTQIIADVGCDHGYLIIEAFNNYGIKKAYAIDNKKGPLDKAIGNLRKYEFYNNIVFLLSDGLEKLEDSVDGIVFAGMGGLLIVELLKKDFEKIKNSKLIIQANRDSSEVRRYLSSNFFEIKAEEIVYEDKKFYEVIVFEKTDNFVHYTEKEIQYGPKLLNEMSNLFTEKLKNDLRILENIPYRSEQIIKKIKEIEDILCL